MRLTIPAPCEFINSNITNYAKEYPMNDMTTYEQLEAKPVAPRQWVTVRGATDSERYGMPWPISGDLRLIESDPQCLEVAGVDYGQEIRCSLDSGHSGKCTP